MPTHRANRRTTAKLLIVDYRRNLDGDGVQIPELRSRQLGEEVIISLRQITFVVSDQLCSAECNELVVPWRWLRPAQTEIRVGEQVVSASLKRVVVRLVAGRARVDGDFAERETRLLRRARVQAAAAQRRRGRVQSVGEEAVA